ncbi:2,3-diaminopropionate biosynthesis protein SbnB, partial [Streptomyces noursei]
MTTLHSAADGSATATPRTVPPFAVISGAQVQRALQGRAPEIVDLIEATYRLHGAGDSVNP